MNLSDRLKNEKKIKLFQRLRETVISRYEKQLALQNPLINKKISQEIINDALIIYYSKKRITHSYHLLLTDSYLN